MQKRNSIFITTCLAFICILSLMTVPRQDPKEGESWATGEPLPSSGTTYYISFSEGNDSNDGLSDATPWKTFNNLNVDVSKINLAPIPDTTYDNGSQCYTWEEQITQGSVLLEPGDTVALKSGDSWNQQLRPMGNGNSTDYIELKSYGIGPAPVIQMNGTEYDKCIVLDGVSYWRINNIEFRDAKLGLYLRYWDDYNNTNVEIENCTFKDMWSLEWERTWEHNFEFSWSCGIFVGGKVYAEQFSPVLDNLRVKNCSFYNCSVGFLDNWYWPDPSFRSRLRNLVLEDCMATGGQTGFAVNFVDGGHARRFHTLDGRGHYACGTTGGFAQSCQNFIIERSIFANIKRELNPDGVGFDFEGDNHNMTFQYNVMHNNDGAGILVMSTIATNTDIKIKNCLFYNNCRNPYKDGVAFELVCYDSDTTGILENVLIYKGDYWNYMTQEFGKTIREAGDDEEDYSIGFLGESKDIFWTKWRNFQQTNVQEWALDPEFDYESLWPIDSCDWCDEFPTIEPIMLAVNLFFILGVIFLFIAFKKKSRK